MPENERIVSDPKPWERQPDETTKAFNAFRYYRRMNPANRKAAAVSFALWEAIGSQSGSGWAGSGVVDSLPLRGTGFGLG
jgi:hypothetical protein